MRYAAFAIIPLMVALIYLFFRWTMRTKATWPCSMDWHAESVNDLVSFDGVSLCRRCPRCKQKVLQDSQGNWFAVSE